MAADDERNSGEDTGVPGQASVNAQYVHWDHLGSTRLLTDEKGIEIGKWKFYPFGHEADTSGGRGNRMKFTGHERDDGLGLDYMLARYYGAAVGRFLSVDPAADSARLETPATWNRYSYAANMPLNAIDPDGRKDRRTDEDKAKLDDSDVRDAVQEAWEMSKPEEKNPDNRQEVGFMIVNAGGGDYTTTKPVTQGNPVNVDIPHPNTVRSGTPEADVHTQPSAGKLVTNPENKTLTRTKSGPGERDRDAAHERGLVTYLVQKHAMFKYDPDTGKQKKILTGKHFRSYMGRDK